MEKSLITLNVLSSRYPFSPFLPTYSLRTFGRKNSFSSRFFQQKRLLNLKQPSLFSVGASSTSNYGGWEDLASSSGSNAFFEFDQLREFFISIGIDDTEQVFMFFLGFVASLGISRVRYLSMAVFPVSVVVFILGFSIGISGSGYGSVLREKNKVRSFYEEIKRLGCFLSDMEHKLSDLRRELESAVGSNGVDTKEMRRYVEMVESVRVSILPARDIMDASSLNDWQPFCDGAMSNSDKIKGYSSSLSSINGRVTSHQQVKENRDHAMSKKRRDFLVFGVDLVRVLAGSLFLEKSSGWNPQQVKGTSKQESVEQLKSVQGNKQTTFDVHGSFLPKGTEEMSMNSASQDNIKNSSKKASLPQEKSEGQNHREALHQENDFNKAVHATTALPLGLGSINGSGFRADACRVSEEVSQGDHSDRVLRNNKIAKETARARAKKGLTLESFELQCNHNDSLPYNDEPMDLENDLNRVNGEGFGKMVHHFQNESQIRQDMLHDPTRTPLGQRPYEQVSPLLGHENTGPACDVPHSPSLRKERDHHLSGNDAFSSGHHFSNHNLDCDTEVAAPFSAISKEEEFDRLLEEAGYLLKKARECLICQVDDETAENILYKSAKLLSNAVSLKPKSLKAVGQLGNTFLLHGELKLKISRDLRTVLSRSDTPSKMKGPRGRLHGSKMRFLSKDRVASMLVDVCEECEEFLLEAGRKYRTALSIDEYDAKALYNWGLALSFRGQLISDIGPEAASDADKVYLAAIDKFDTLMSKSNSYAPDALFRWGQILQLRSFLRTNGCKEKVKLLEQAKRLFEDSLLLNNDNLQFQRSKHLNEKVQKAFSKGSSGSATSALHTLDMLQLN
ncbi:hypothetical protein H6P81_016873 [Aristolochia fimbriata]|uniref:Uncharacterized protein n=1 Tax=Aristolochia fimbriata TaxID=158543 RepID=A0AAV7DWW7_ARIFI|nr:hypothetical protein H6P81_016873 [Aristolochia fimbriata]